jgi:hypothetical protein
MHTQWRFDPLVFFAIASCVVSNGDLEVEIVLSQRGLDGTPDEQCPVISRNADRYSWPAARFTE